MFFILHLMAVIFMLPALLITIPLHMIYNKVGNKTVKKESDSVGYRIGYGLSPFVRLCRPFVKLGKKAWGNK